MPDDRDSDRLERAWRGRMQRDWRPPPRDHDAPPPPEYFAKLGRLRLEIIRRHYRGGTVLDVGCGPGDYLRGVSRFAEHVVGVDFSPEQLAVAAERLPAEARASVSLVLGNARALPLRDRTVALLYAYSTLYIIPRVGEAVDECARVLEDGGLAILEFGNLTSLNTLVARAEPGAPPPCHLTLPQMSRILRSSGLAVVSHRAFQLLPLYSFRPRWLRPLLHPWWRPLMAREFGGRMLDEWLSTSRPLTGLAFRHIFVARKDGGPARAGAGASKL